MFNVYDTPEMLAYVAGACYVLGLVIIHQIILRLLILLGTSVYVLYYATVAEQPLMDAIYVSLLIGSANVIGLCGLLFRQSRLAVPRDSADAFEIMPPLPPGDFRVLMKLARRRRLAHDEILTREGEPGQRLYFVISGTTQVRKGQSSFTMPPECFVGEVAFLTQRPCSATAWLAAGSEILEWDAETLRRRCARSLRFKLAIEASISVDLAAKVARGIGPDSIRHPEAPSALQLEKAG